MDILLYPTLYIKLCNVVYILRRSKLFCYIANSILLGKAVLFGGIDTILLVSVVRLAAMLARAETMHLPPTEKSNI